MNKELIKYIETHIFPIYETYYSHGMIHIHNVIKNTLLLAKDYQLDENMCYTMAAYHDVGLNIDRENHEKESANVLIHDTNLAQFFTDEQLTMIKEAIEDHRGSRKIEPRNIYGKVLSDSDRDFDIQLLAKRQLATSIKNYPEITSFNEHFERCYQYLLNRLNLYGHFNLWTNHALLVQQREKFEKDFLDKAYARLIYKKEYDKISKDGTIEKIKNYYQDF